LHGNLLPDTLGPNRTACFWSAAAARQASIKATAPVDQPAALRGHHLLNRTGSPGRGCPPTTSVASGLVVLAPPQGRRRHLPPNAPAPPQPTVVNRKSSDRPWTPDPLNLFTGSLARISHPSRLAVKRAGEHTWMSTAPSRDGPRFLWRQGGPCGCQTHLLTIATRAAVAALVASCLPILLGVQPSLDHNQLPRARRPCPPAGLVAGDPRANPNAIVGETAPTAAWSPGFRRRDDRVDGPRSCHKCSACDPAFPALLDTGRSSRRRQTHGQWTGGGCGYLSSCQRRSGLASANHSLRVLGGVLQRSELTGKECP